MQANFFRNAVWEHDATRTMRREVMTVQREQRMLLFESISLEDFDTCPLCGQMLPAIPVVREERYPGEFTVAQDKKAPRRIL